MQKKIKIGIAEDHDLVRQGMVALLEDEPNLSVQFDVANGAELLEILKEKKVDVLLLDLTMPIIDGHEALKVITERYTKIRTIIISMHYQKDFITQSIADGARGFLPKNCDFDKVVDAIFSVNERGYFFDENVSQALISEILHKDKAPSDFTSPLSARELEIIELICQGRKNREIAESLFLSVRTVEGHRQRIAEKTEATNIAELVIYAIKNGIYKMN